MYRSFAAEPYLLRREAKKCHCFPTFVVAVGIPTRIQRAKLLEWRPREIIFRLGGPQAMSIRATCSGCGKVIKAGDDWDGRTGNCPGCGAIVSFEKADAFAGFEEFVEAQEEVNSDILHPPVIHVPAPLKRCAATPKYRGSTGATAFAILAAIALLFGVAVEAVAQSAIHEIEAGVAFLLFAILALGSLICSIGAMFRDAVAHAAELARENSADQLAAINQLRAELEWQRAQKEKETVRGKAGDKKSHVNDTAK